MKPPPALIMLLLALFCASLYAQEKEGGNVTAAIPVSYPVQVTQKAAALSHKLDKKTAAALAAFQKQQQRLYRKLYKNDSAAATAIRNATTQRVRELEQKLQQPPLLISYIPALDTLKTSLAFLKDQREYIGRAGDMQQKLAGAMDTIRVLEAKLQQAEQVKQLLKEQRQYLIEQLQQFGFVKELKQLNRQVYYYSRQVNEYKEILKDKKKIEKKAIALLSNTRPFRDFMKKNSVLAGLFRMPTDDVSDAVYRQSLAGLQTREQVSRLIQNQAGVGGSAARQQIQSSIQQAQGQLQQLKNKLAQYGASGSEDIMPEGFKPNNQKTKSFLKRLEYGMNTQSDRGNSFLPVTSDIGLSVGYKLNDKSIIGIGGSYKVGWGKNIRQLKVTHQGVGVRSFIDYEIRAKGWGLFNGLWLSGGFEMNYRSEIKSIEELKAYSAWQQSGLLGITKKLPINLKFFKNTKLQLLWDFLSYRQVPRTQAVLFRVGYGL